MKQMKIWTPTAFRQNRQFEIKRGLLANEKIREIQIYIPKYMIARIKDAYKNNNKNGKK